MAHEQSISCPFCGHIVSLFANSGYLHIAGHHYTKLEEERHVRRYHQIGGPDVEEVEPETYVVTRHCAGGSLRIVGTIQEDSFEVVWEDKRVTRIHIKRGV